MTYPTHGNLLLESIALPMKPGNWFDIKISDRYFPNNYPPTREELLFLSPEFLCGEEYTAKGDIW